MVGIEVKNTETVTTHDFNGLKKLQKDSGEDFLRGILLYADNKQHTFGKNLIAVPISSLWT